MSDQEQGVKSTIFTVTCGLVIHEDGEDAQPAAQVLFKWDESELKRLVASLNGDKTMVFNTLASMGISTGRAAACATADTLIGIGAWPEQAREELVSAILDGIASNSHKWLEEKSGRSSHPSDSRESTDERD